MRCTDGMWIEFGWFELRSVAEEVATTCPVNVWCDAVCRGIQSLSTGTHISDSTTSTRTHEHRALVRYTLFTSQWEWEWPSFQFADKLCVIYLLSDEFQIFLFTQSIARSRYTKINLIITFDEECPLAIGLWPTAITVVCERNSHMSSFFFHNFFLSILFCCKFHGLFVRCRC